jgi:hypothetical protein
MADKDAVSAALVAHFVDADALKLDPWRAERKKAKRFAEQALSLSYESDALESAKAGQLTADEVITLTYTLYATEEKTMKILNRLLLEKRGMERIRIHNWYVAEALGEDWLTSNGEAVAKLAFPLFPPRPEYSTLNKRLLLSVSSDVVGGGQSPSAANGPASMYAQPVPGNVPHTTQAHAPAPARAPKRPPRAPHAAAANQVAGGAMPLFVQHDVTTGSYYVDAEGIAHAIHNAQQSGQQALHAAQGPLVQRIAELERLIGIERGRGGDRGGRGGRGGGDRGGGDRGGGDRARGAVGRPVRGAPMPRFGGGTDGHYYDASATHVEDPSSDF